MMPGNRCKYLFPVAALAVFLFLQIQLKAQIYGNTAIGTGIDDNMFKNEYGSSSGYGLFELTAGYTTDSSNFSGEAFFDYSYFSNFPDRYYLSPGVSLLYDLYYGTDDINSLQISINGSKRINGSETKYFDYNNVYAKAVAEYYLFGNLILTGGVISKYKDFLEFPEMTHFENYFSAGLRYSLPTKTGLNAGLSFGNRYYTDDLILALESSPENGYKRGQNGRQAMMAQKRGGGSAMATKRYQTAGDAYSPAVLSGDAGTQVINITFGVSQSLAEKTGASINLKYKKILNSNGRLLISGTSNYFGDLEIFDDPFSFDSRDIKAALTHILPYNIKGRTEFAYSQKEYYYPADIESYIGEMRSDEFSQFSLSFEKTFDESSFLIFGNFGISFNYSYIHNLSNSKYFEYNSNFASITFTTEF